MINPGGFLTISDTVTLRPGQVATPLHSSTDDIAFTYNTAQVPTNEPIQRVRIYRSTLATTLFPWGISPIWTGSSQYAQLVYENMLFLERLTPWFECTEENLKARLTSPWAQYSFATIYALPIYKREARLSNKELRTFIKAHATIPWSYCKVSNLFVPNRYKVAHTPGTRGFFPHVRYGSITGLASKVLELLRFPLRMEPSVSRYGTSSGELLNYSTRATDLLPFLKKDTNKSEIYYGLELEYENRTARNITETKALLNNYAILKRDGSVNNGFEICSAPAQFEIHKEKLLEFFKRLPELELRAESNTGMHVHISKEPMSFLQLGKIFAMLNNRENEELLEKIAGRRANHYCTRTDVDNLFSFPLRIGNAGSRYSRLNLNNANTIELRMFSTPMSYKDCMHKLEFCKALVDLTAPATTNKSLKDFAKIDTLVKFVSQQHKAYPHLAQLIGA